MSAECPDPGPGGPQSQALRPGRHYGTLVSGQCPPTSAHAPWSLPRWRAYVAAAVLCYINLLNYMNWFVIAGEEGTSILGLHLLVHPSRLWVHILGGLLPSIFSRSTSLVFSPLEVVSSHG